MVLQEFIDELDAIEAIYPSSLTKLTENIIEIIIHDHQEFKVRLSFNDEYPDQQIPPNILLVSSTRKVDKALDDKLVSLFQLTLNEIFNQGQVCLFDFLTEIEPKLADFKDAYPEDDQFEYDDDYIDYSTTDEELTKHWAVSNAITDRGSTFMGFACEVHSDDDVNERLYQLRTNRKVAKSQHSMCAWRIKNADGTIILDSDDDGETAAGSRMLHLMTLMEAWNCLVVDVRWFGGTHIGPDRFKHINSTSREALINGGFSSAEKKK